ncbi:MAG: pitrilysin family protein, partial [Anaerovoracaceae bacterium]
MIETKKLDCGITLVTEKMPNMKSVAIGIWVKTGAANEAPEIAGISHFIEHMLFKGTTTRTAKALAEDVDKIGGQINAFTGKEATCYYIKTLESNLETSMDILFDMFRESLFDKKEMAREKKVIAEEMKMIKDTPDEDAHDTICELVFKDNPLGKSIIGTTTTLKRISREVLMDYIDQQYTKDSIVVSVAGNFQSELVEEIIAGRLDGLKEKKNPVEYPEETYVPSFKVKVKDIEQTHLCLATRSVSLADPRYYAFALLNNIMGGSMSSRF